MTGSNEVLLLVCKENMISPSFRQQFRSFHEHRNARVSWLKVSTNVRAMDDAERRTQIETTKVL